jgi:hypothetical protein
MSPRSKYGAVLSAHFSLRTGHCARHRLKVPLLGSQDLPRTRLCVPTVHVEFDIKRGPARAPKKIARLSICHCGRRSRPVAGRGRSLPERQRVQRERPCESKAGPPSRIMCVTRGAPLTRRCRASAGRTNGPAKRENFRRGSESRAYLAGRDR